MANINEASRAQTALKSVLTDSLGTLSQEQEITFTLYARLVLPVDGYVFWVRSELLSRSALFNAMGFNTSAFNEPLEIEAPAPTISVQGSLHYSSQRILDETENFALNKVVFTSEKPIEPLNKIGPGTLWIGTFADLTFAFGSHALLYQVAGLWHYEGFAVYPDMRPQIIDKLSAFSAKQIVSNSLPFWLKMNNSPPAFFEAFGNDIPLYPSYGLPANILPPWGSVHIPPESTEAIQVAPRFSKKMSRWQLVRETVVVTLYGLNNEAALDFADFVQQFATNTDYFGIMNQPVPRDDKRTQQELGTLAKKKTMTFEVNYYQARSNEIARQLILSAIPTYIVGDL